MMRVTDWICTICSAIRGMLTGRRSYQSLRGFLLPFTNKTTLLAI